MEKIRNLIKSKLRPREYVNENVPFAAEVNLSPWEVKWILNVKKESEKALRRFPKSISAYDLVLVHLMLQRDLKKGGPNWISPETEKKLDEILNYIFMHEQKLDENKANRLRRDAEDILTIQIIGLYDTLQSNPDAKHKASILSRYLTLVHNTNFGLRAFLGSGDDTDDFLTTLNNLGNPNF